MQYTVSARVLYGACCALMHDMRLLMEFLHNQIHPDVPITFVLLFVKTKIDVVRVRYYNELFSELTYVVDKIASLSDQILSLFVIMGLVMNTIQLN